MAFDPLADIQGLAEIQAGPQVVSQSATAAEETLKLKLVGSKGIEKLRRRLLGRRRGEDVSIGDLISEALRRLDWIFNIEDAGGQIMYKDQTGTNHLVDFDKPK